MRHRRRKLVTLALAAAACVNTGTAWTVPPPTSRSLPQGSRQCQGLGSWRKAGCRSQGAAFVDVRHRAHPPSGNHAESDDDPGGLEVAWTTLRPQLRALGAMGLVGSVIGPALDAFHSRASIVVYDVGAVYIPAMGWKTDMFVPPLLGAFFAVAGALVLLADAALLTAGAAPTPPRRRWSRLFRPPPAAAPTFPGVAASFGGVALLNQLSGVLYGHGVPHVAILAAVGALGAGLWAAADRTAPGLALCLLCAGLCPLLEAPLMSPPVGLWHYPQGGALGHLSFLGQSLPCFLPAFYFVFAVPVPGLTRFMAGSLGPGAPPRPDGPPGPGPGCRGDGGSDACPL